MRIFKKIIVALTLLLFCLPFVSSCGIKGPPKPPSSEAEQAQKKEAKKAKKKKQRSSGEEK